MKKLNVVLHSLTLATLAGLISLSLVQASEGGHSGGGGGAYICSDPSQSEFLDLYELRHAGFHQTLTSNAPVESQIQSAFARLQMPLSKLLKDMYVTVRSARIRTMPVDQDLAWPSDEENRYAKKGCPGVGIMVFYDEDNSMDQNTAALNSLPNEEQAAAWVHETVYKFLRETQGDQDSKRTQSIVGMLFSTESDEYVQTAINNFGTMTPHLSVSGVSFIRDITYPSLGEAYRDPNGLIWGDVALNSDPERTVKTMNHQDAVNYCVSIGARLPTGNESYQLVIKALHKENVFNGDPTYSALKYHYSDTYHNVFFGPDSITVLPHLPKGPDSDDSLDFWTSTKASSFWQDRDSSEVFTGSDKNSALHAVRCVVEINGSK